MKKILKEYFTGCLTVPNLLSFLRIVMVPIFAVLFHQADTVGRFLCSLSRVSATSLTAR